MKTSLESRIVKLRIQESILSPTIKSILQLEHHHKKRKEVHMGIVILYSMTVNLKRKRFLGSKLSTSSMRRLLKRLMKINVKNKTKQSKGK
jgi:hypothetical protein